MKRVIPWYLVALMTGLLTLSSINLLACEAGRSAPEFTHSADNEWIYSQPLLLRNLQDKVVLIDFWTFGS